MNDDTDLISLTEMIKVFGEEFNTVVGREIESLLPDTRHGVDAGAGAGSGIPRTKSLDLVCLDVVKMKLLDNFGNKLVEIWGGIEIHIKSIPASRA